MAENETLDLYDRRNAGWARCCRNVAAGAPADETGRLAALCVLRTMKKLLARHPVTGFQQFPVGELVQAVSQGKTGDVRSVLIRSNGHEYAQLLADCDPSLPAMVTAQFVDRTFERFLDQFELELSGSARFPTFNAFAEYRQRMREAAGSELSRIGDAIAMNPDQPPRARSRARGMAGEEQSAMLRESLLGGGGSR